MESAAATIVSLITTLAEKAGRQLPKQVYICYNKHYYYHVVTLCMSVHQAAALFCFSSEVKGERRILAESCMRKKELLYVIKPAQQTKESLLRILSDHKEVKYVSLMGVDLAGNDTDEKIPINIFLEDLDKFLNGSAAQTDGSSVVLPGIATLNDARVDMEVDRDVNWYVDYNYEHFDDYGNMVGTLRLPCFLIHNGDYVDSRSILKKTLTYVEAELLALFKQYPHMPGLEK